MFSPLSKFPHVVEVTTTTKAVDYSTHPPKVTREVSTESLRAFMDTPATNEALLYHQRDIQVSRFLYLPYGIPVEPDDVITFEGVTYKPSGALEDQGGQHIVNRLPLKEVRL